PHFRLEHRGVPVTVHGGPTTRPHEPDTFERLEFLDLFRDALERFRPDVLVGYGGNRLAGAMFAEARRRGMVTVFALHNFSYTDAGPFAHVDAVIVPSRFAAEHYRKTLGLDCTVLPNLIDLGRVRAEGPERRFVTFVNPSFEKGVYVFSR